MTDDDDDDRPLLPLAVLAGSLNRMKSDTLIDPGRLSRTWPSRWLAKLRRFTGPIPAATR